MRPGCVGLMLKPRCNCRSGWGKGHLDQKKHDELVKDQGDVGCVFWLEKHCPSWICTTWSDGKQTVVPGSFCAFEGCCVQEEDQTVGKPTWMLPHDTASAHASLLIPSYLAKHHTSVVPHPPYSPDLHQQTFSCFLNSKPLWKDVISKPQRRFRKKSDKRTARYHRKCVPKSIPTMEETLGTSYRK